MARLRQEHEATSYASLLSPSNSIVPPGIASSNEPPPALDDFTLAATHRQLTLVLNMLVSVIACGIAGFLIAGGAGWSAGARVGVGLATAGVVAVAEVGVYVGYVARVRAAREKEDRKMAGGKQEVKEVVATWMVGGGVVEGGGDVPGLASGPTSSARELQSTRRRKVEVAKSDEL